MKATRLILALAAIMLLPLLAVPASAATRGHHRHHGGWHVVYSNQFRSLQDVHAAQSPAKVNGTISPSDTRNGQLQKPTVHQDVTIAHTGSDGHALQVATRAARFQTPRGPWYGVTNGRVSVGPTFSLAGHKLLVRLRGIGNGKAASMIWPAKGWPWEIDFAEWFPGSGSSKATARHHMAFGGGGATHQLISLTGVNRDQWHTYGVEFLGSKSRVTGVRYTVDGKPMRFNENGRVVTTITGAWVPHTGRGALAIGKAVPGPRYATPLSHFDAVQVDWMKLLAR